MTDELDENLSCLQWVEGHLYISCFKHQKLHLHTSHDLALYQEMQRRLYCPAGIPESKREDGGLKEAKILEKVGPTKAKEGQGLKRREGYRLNLQAISSPGDFFNQHKDCYLKEARAILMSKNWHNKNRCVKLLGD